MNRFSIIILRFFLCENFWKQRNFSKNLEKIQPPTLKTKKSPAAAADREKKIEIS
jgi:hypothetical protein